MLRLRDDATQWFSELRLEKVGLKFDIYYFCLMAGFAGVRKARLDDTNATDLIGYFPGEYLHRRELLIGCLICAELADFNIDVRDKAAVKGIVSGLVSPMSQTGLGSEGEKALNAYASGGFDELTEHIDDRPRNLATFLRRYPVVLQKISQRRQERVRALSGPGVVDGNR